MRVYLCLRQEPFYARLCGMKKLKFISTSMPAISTKNLSLTNKCNNDWEYHLDEKMTLGKEETILAHLYSLIPNHPLQFQNCFMTGTSAQIEEFQDNYV